MAASFDKLRKRHRGYSGARPDVVSLLPETVTSLLDVGCGAGVTGDLVRQKHPGVRLIGVEPDPILARHAEKNFDEVLRLGIDCAQTIAALRAHAPFSAIFCADVLEHLVDPASVLLQLRSLLSEDGVLITSIPNVRHVSTFVSLGLFGTWPARDRGIHDRTHLRFYARKNILDLGESAGLKMVREKRNLRLLESVPATMIPAKLMDFWPFRGFLTFQYLHVWIHEQRLARTQAA